MTAFKDEPRKRCQSRYISVTGIKHPILELERSAQPRTVQDLSSVECRRSHGDVDSGRTHETEANGGNVNSTFDFFPEKGWVLSVSTSLLL